MNAMIRYPLNVKHLNLQIRISVRDIYFDAGILHDQVHQGIRVHHWFYVRMRHSFVDLVVWLHLLAIEDDVGALVSHGIAVIRS